ncbi:MAG: sulfotransferase [Devosia sp.]
MVSTVQPRERLLSAALAAHRAGRLDDAAGLYRRTIAAHPGSDVAHHNLGLIDHAAGRLAEAEANIGKAIKINPRSAIYLTNMASVLEASGKPQEALDYAGRALALEPRLAAAHNTMGLALADLDRLDESEAAYQQALRFEPRGVDTMLNLARLCLRQDRPADAQRLAQSALHLHPSHGRAFVVLGDALMAQKRVAGAAEVFGRAIAGGFDNAEVNAKLGEALSESGQAESARARFERAVQLAPEIWSSHASLGRFLQLRGELGAAATSFRTALGLNPGKAQLRNALSQTVSHTGRMDPEIIALLEAHARSDAGSQDRMHLAFGLGKAFEDIKDYGAAFDFIAEGNAIRRASLDYSTEAEIARFRNMASTFSADYLAAHRARGSDSTRPVFIIGMPRSGTTLTEQILASHPQVLGAGELQFVETASSQVLGYRLVIEPARLLKTAAPDFSAIGRTYLGWLPDASSGQRFVTDKLPQNFLLAGLIHLVFPHAHIVHVRRAPLDNCLSIFKNDFSGDALPFSYDLVELGHYYNLYRDLMRHWHAVMPGVIHDVQYEDLVSEPEATSRALLDYCGLDWRPEVLDFHLNKRQIKTASFAQVRRPIYKDSVNLSARYGDRLQPLIDTLAEWND